MTGQDVDKIARDIIAKGGFGKQFTHSTGHGVGLEVHEKPHITFTKPGSNVLEIGTTFTIEPGIYVDGNCGVRIENSGVMTAKGFVPFTKSPKEPFVL